ncbi:MAG: trimethylamine methyltransferase family protein [Desulfobacterales bacterium]|nr:trimethylamine methyltransferase family protein [Desulfobacterales bacterium]
MKQIHRSALKILKNVGFRFLSDKACHILKERGVTLKGDRAFFTEEEIAHWLAMAPDSFTLRAANPAFDTTIGGDHVTHVSGYGCSSVMDLDGSCRHATLLDYITFAKLVHQTPQFKINGGILAQPTDVPAELSHLIMLYAAMLHSDKALMGIPGSSQQMEELIQLASLRMGGDKAFKESPRLLTMISTISPLQIDEMGVGSILVSARHNQPLIISPAPAAGTTGPIELAGNLALATAEALAAICFTQMVNPGTPVLFGLQCYGANLTTANISIGSPAYALQAKYTAALARYYNIPSRCGGATTDAAAHSCQSGYEAMFSLFSGRQNRINLMVHSAGILESFSTISYAQFLSDTEMMEMIDAYEKDVEITDKIFETSLDLIQNVGPGGEFLTSRETMVKCRTHSWTPSVGVRHVPSGINFHEAEKIRMEKRLTTILKAHQKPKIETPTLASMDAFMLDHGVSKTTLAQIKGEA